MNTCKRLNLIEKSWFKLAKHFTLLLSDRDTKELMAIQKLIEEWKTAIEETRVEVVSKENRLKIELANCKSDLDSLRSLFLDIVKL